MKHKKDKTKFHLIEGHSKDQTDQFIQLYNSQKYTKQQIKEKLQIGEPLYKKYKKATKEQLKNRKKTKNCAFCKKKFHPISPNHKYCSDDCKKEASKIRRKRKREKMKE